MLTKSEFRRNFTNISCLCKLKLIPLDFEIEEVTLSVPNKTRSRSVVWLLVFSLHFIFVTVRLGQSLTWKPVEQHVLFFQLVQWSVSLLGYAWYFMNFLISPNVFVALFNSIFVSNDSENHLRTNGRNSINVLGRTIPIYSRQELLAKSLPVLTALSELAIVCMFIYERNLSFLLVSTLPEYLQGNLSFVLLLPEELYYFIFLGVNGTLAWQVQLLFCEKVIHTLKSMRVNACIMAYSYARALEDYKKIRHLQLLVLLFNDLNSYILFCTKVFCISISTLSGYFALAYFNTNPIFGLMYYTFLITLSLTYSLLYEKAFAVPTETEHTKTRISIAATHQPRPVRQMFKKRLRSIPAFGIRVGHFHTFERMSTPIFIDFIIKNIVGLLVMND